MVVPVIWALPDWMERREPGVVVPRPRKPLLRIVRVSMLLEFASANARVAPAPFPVMDSRAVGLDEPMPMLPELLSIHRSGLDVPTAKSALPVGVDDAIYNGPANEEVAVVEVEVMFGNVVVA